MLARLFHHHWLPSYFITVVMPLQVAAERLATALDTMLRHAGNADPHTSFHHVTIISNLSKRGTRRRYRFTTRAWLDTSPVPKSSLKGFHCPARLSFSLSRFAPSVVVHFLSHPLHELSTTTFSALLINLHSPQRLASSVRTPFSRPRVYGRVGTWSWPWSSV